MSKRETTPDDGGDVASEFQAYMDEAASPPALVVQVGKTQLRYHLRCIEDVRAMLQKHGDWMLLGGADEQKPAADGTVEAWGRSSDNPVKGWYGLKKGLAAASRSTYLPSSRRSALPSSSTIRRTTACAPSRSDAWYARTAVTLKDVLGHSLDETREPARPRVNAERDASEPRSAPKAS